MSKICFFIGHRETPYAIKEDLLKAVERVIQEDGITQFVVGHYGSFDQMATTVVKEIKSKHAGISLLLLLPYHPTERQAEISNGFDGTYYPEGQEFVPKRLAIVNANQAMVNQCDVLIAYAKYPGNSRNLVEYAHKRGVSVINLALLKE